MVYYVSERVIKFDELFQGLSLFILFFGGM